MKRLTLLFAALACGCAQAETLQGQLERGPAHSVLWAVSPESGDLIGQAFANASQAGQTILAQCLPGLHCVAEGAAAAEPPEDLAAQLRFSAQPSGWWFITQAGSAHMEPSLPLHERELSTRYGRLAITDEYLLLFNGRPVLGSQPPPAPSAQAAPPAHPSTLLERISAWWQSWWGQVRSHLLALLGRPCPPAPQPAATPAAPPNGTAEAVQGNAALHIVAHYELEGQDVALLQDTGGLLCPAVFRFATLTPQGIAVTPEFGSCSDIATATLEKAQDGTPEPWVRMAGSRDPIAALGETEPAPERMQLRRFVLRQGQVQEVPAVQH